MSDAGAAELQVVSEMFDRHFREFAEEHGWVPLRSNSYLRGACRDFRCGDLVVRLANEHGLIETSIGSVADQSSLRPLSIYKDFVEPAAQGRWNLSFSEQVDFLKRRWTTLEEMLAPDRWRLTLAMISRL